MSSTMGASQTSEATGFEAQQRVEVGLQLSETTDRSRAGAFVTNLAHKTGERIGQTFDTVLDTAAALAVAAMRSKTVLGGTAALAFAALPAGVAASAVKDGTRVIVNNPEGRQVALPPEFVYNMPPGKPALQYGVFMGLADTNRVQDCGEKWAHQVLRDQEINKKSPRGRTISVRLVPYDGLGREEGGCQSDPGDFYENTINDAGENEMQVAVTRKAKGGTTFTRVSGWTEVPVRSDTPLRLRQSVTTKTACRAGGTEQGLVRMTFNPHDPGAPSVSQTFQTPRIKC